MYFEEIMLKAFIVFATILLCAMLTFFGMLGYEIYKYDPKTDDEPVKQECECACEHGRHKIRGIPKHIRIGH